MGYQAIVMKRKLIFSFCVLLIFPVLTPVFQANGATGSFLLKKNIFLPIAERNKSDASQDAGAAADDDFKDKYLLYGIINVGSYKTAIFKINPKLRHKVPEDLWKKKLLRLKSGEELDGHKVMEIGDDFVVFLRGNGERLTVPIFDNDMKPERKKGVSVAKATPRALPPRPVRSPAIRDNKGAIKPRASVNKKASSNKGKKKGRAAPVKNSKAHRNKGSSKRPSVKRPPTVHRPPKRPASSSVNPFLQAIKKARERQRNSPAPSSTPSTGVNPFLQFLNKHKTK